MGNNTSQKLLEATVLRLSSPNLPGAAKRNQKHRDLSSEYRREESMKEWGEEWAQRRERGKGQVGERKDQVGREV